MGTFTLTRDQPERFQDRDSRGRLPLHAACQIFLELGLGQDTKYWADWNYQDAEQEQDWAERIVALFLAAYPEGALVADCKGRLPLHYACGNGASLRTLERLLDKNPQGIATSDDDGYLPIHHACYGLQYGRECSSAAHRLLNFLASKDPSTVLKRTTKDLLLPVDVLGIISIKSKILLKYYPDDEKRSYYKARARAWRSCLASPKKRREALQGMVQDDKDIFKEKNNIGLLPLHELIYFFREGKHVGRNELLDLQTALEQFPGAAEIPDNQCRLPLHQLLLLCGELQDISFCIPFFEDLIRVFPPAARQPDASGNLPLQLAIQHLVSCRCGMRVLTELIPAYPESAWQEDQQGCVPFAQIVTAGYPPDHLEIFLSLFPNSLECFPVHLALEQLQRSSTASIEPGAMKVLLDKYPTAPVDFDNNGSLPLHIAAVTAKDAQTVRFLIERNPAALGTYNNCLLPLHLAIKNSAPASVVKELIESGPAAVSVPLQDGSTCLHLLCKYGSSSLLRAADCKDIMTTLLAAFPDAASIADAKGQLPIHLACQNGFSNGRDSNI
jgi:ankyrin repeat protein